MDTDTQVSLQTFADAERVLAAALPGYERRPQQQELAGRVEQHLASQDDEPTHLFGSAPCGVGKTLAYLIPAILSAKRVIVSVTTRSLQDQLATKDLPFLEQHLGIPVSWCVLKGRSNYLCLNRALASDVPNLARVVEATKRGDFDGTRESLGFELAPREWSKVCADAEECRSNECRRRYTEGDDGCYAVRARETAQSRKVVVVNHALLCTDLALGAKGLPTMLGTYDTVVLDEVHELEHVAADHLGSRTVLNTFVSLTAELRSWAGRYADEDSPGLPLTELVGAAGELFDALPLGRVRRATLGEVAEQVDRLFVVTTELLDAWRRQGMQDVPSDDYRRAKDRHKTLLARIGNLIDTLQEVVAADWGEVVRWVEEETSARGERRKALRTAPVHVGEFLGEHLFGATPTTMVSATITVGGRFDFIAGRLGVGRFSGVVVGSPFDFPRQSRLYVPRHLPDPKLAVSWERAAIEEIASLIGASRGRALVLCTSMQFLRKVRDELRGSIDYPLLVQGEGSNAQLAQRFLDEEDSVLLGSKSFMTGFDPRGATCSLVIISKLPFPVPTDPLVEARCDAISARGGNAFGEYTTPVMSLDLQQAAGRLIRHRDDTGVVAILDPRLATKPYGRKIMGDLPPMARVSTVGDVREFLSA